MRSSRSTSRLVGQRLSLTSKLISSAQPSSSSCRLLTTIRPLWSNPQNSTNSRLILNLRSMPKGSASPSSSTFGMMTMRRASFSTSFSKATWPNLGWKMPAAMICLAAGIHHFKDDNDSKPLEDDASGRQDGKFYSIAGADVAKQLTTSKKKNKFHLCRPLVVSTWDKIVIAILIPFTAGLALLFLKPWLEFRHYTRAISRMRIDGKRLKFTGDLADYMILYIQNLVLSVVTFGIYALMGVPERKIADYVDSHIEWDDAPEVVVAALPAPPKVD